MTEGLFSLFFYYFNHLFFSAYISFICNILHALCFFHFIRFIEKKIPQEITIKFHQNITRPWTTFSEYPKEQSNMFYELYDEIDELSLYGQPHPNPRDSIDRQINQVPLTIWPTLLMKVKKPFNAIK